MASAGRITSAATAERATHRESEYEKREQEGLHRDTKQSVQRQGHGERRQQHGAPGSLNSRADASSVGQMTLRYS